MRSGKPPYRRTCGFNITWMTVSHRRPIKHGLKFSRNHRCSKPRPVRPLSCGTTLTAALRNYRREGKCLPLRNSGSHNKTPAMLRPILRRSPWNRKGSKSLKPNNN